MAGNKLKFSPDRLITGINIIDNMLFFTDNENEPKKINIDQFKSATHTSGTTIIYGREFLERDITVIRPHPIEAVDLSLSATPEVAVDGKEPSITTKGYENNETSANLFGFSIENGTAFKERGFYYLQSDTQPTITTLFANGEKLEASLGDNSFNEKTNTLITNKDYYFAAYGKTEIGGRIEGEILSFHTDAASVSGLDILTLDPITVFNNNKKLIRLRGKINNDGGGDIIEIGFAVRLLGTNQSAPTDLLDDSGNLLLDQVGSIKLYAVDFIYDKATGEFYRDIDITPNQISYFQAYARNKSEYDDGAVKQFPEPSDNQNVGAVAPDVETNPRSTSVRNDTNAKLTGEVTNPYGNIRKVGFYFSKATSDQDQLITKYNTDTSIFKQQVSVPLNKRIFEFDTSSQSGLSLTKGETLYFMAYAENNDGLEGYGDVIPLSYLLDSSKPSIATIVDPNKAFELNNGSNSIKCGLNLSSDNLTIQELGWYIAKSKIGTDLFPGTSFLDVNNKLKLKSKYENGEAVFFNAGNFNRGTQFKNFKGSGNVSLERGFDYYIAATALASNGERAIGDIIKVPFQTISDGTAVASFLKTYSASNVQATTARFNGRLTAQPLGGSSLDSAGFVWALSTNSLETVKASGLQHVSLTSSNLTSLNNFINTGSGNGNQFFADVTGLPSSSTIYFQAWIKQTSSSSRKYAQAHSAFGNANGAGILNFSTPALAPTVKEGVINMGQSNETAKNVTLTATLVNNGGSGKTLVDMSPEFLYMKTSIVNANAAAAEDARKLYIYSNANSPANSDSGIIGADISASSAYLPHDTKNSVGLTFGITKHISSSAELEANTSYYYFMLANNGMNDPSADIGFGSGVFDSQSLKIFRTRATPPTPPKPQDVEVSNATLNQASFSADIHTDGGDRNFTSAGFYYIRSSVYSGSSVSGLVANSSKITVNSNPNNYINATVNNLSPGVEYKVVAFLQNANGVGYSENIETFTTSVSTSQNSILIGSEYEEMSMMKEYSSNGAPEDGDDHVFIRISPNDSDYTFKFSVWDNRDYNIPTAQKTFTSSGNRVLKIDVPNNSSFSSRTCTLTVTHSKDISKTNMLRIVQSATSNHSNPGFYNYGGMNSIYNPYYY